MTGANDIERLSVPCPISVNSAASSPSTPPSSTSNSHGCGLPKSDSVVVQNSQSKDHLSVLARSVSHNSRHTSILSSRQSVLSIRSHVSSFQNVRFEPDPIKDISFWGGLALLISNMTGPGLVTIPVVAQSAGWLPTILGFGLVGLLSTLSSLFICEAMTEVPGNEYFQSNVEFSNLVLCFFGRRYHLLVQIICFLAMQTTNIASIAVSAQLFDNLLIKLFKRTCGIAIYPHPSFVCVSEQLESASPFSGVMIMTAGVLLALAMIVPLALLKLSENIWLQLASFVLILLIVLQWIVTFFTHGLDTSLVPVIGPDISQTFGTILFNYAFITTVPSWANAKQPSVSIHKSLGWSVGVTTVIYLCVAIIGGMAFHIPANSSLIQAINASPDVTVLSQITGYTFPIAALITSIPINIIVIRYNLIQSGACNMVWSNILSGVLPWLIAIPCMTGAGLTTIINWSSLFLVSTANFVIPFILYIYSKKHREKLNKLPYIELEQQARLSREHSRSSFSGHTRRGASVSGSIRRRPTGASISSNNNNNNNNNHHTNTTNTSTHIATQSHAELPITPPSALAAASIVPFALGIGSGSVVHHSIPEEHRSGTDRAQPTSVHRRYHSHQHTSHGSGHGGRSDTVSEPMGGPYFSFSRDGELFEGENVFGHETDSRSAASSVHRPSGVSTVVLHDPMSEMAQRKVTLPRRISHKDKILSMISERHKRALGQQEKIIQDQQSNAPVPPMILLSQSMVESEGSDGEKEQMAQNQGETRTPLSSSAEFRDPEKCDDLNIVTHHSNDSFEDSTQSTLMGKKMNRTMSFVPARKSASWATLSMPPSSPPPKQHSPTPNMLEKRTASAEYIRPVILQSSEHPDTISGALSGFGSRSRIPSSPTEPIESIRSSREFREHTIREHGIPEDEEPQPEEKDRGPGHLRTTTFGSLAPYGSSHSHPGIQPPSTPESCVSLYRPSSSQENHTSLSPPEVKPRSSFSSETKRTVKAAMASLARGTSPHRLGSSLGSGSGSGSVSGSSHGGGSAGFMDSKSSLAEWNTTLLGKSDEEASEENESIKEEEDEDVIGPELSLAGTQSVGTQGSMCSSPSLYPGTRRDSTGRMAAAFSSQAGSFSIHTTVVHRSKDGIAGMSTTTETFSDGAPPNLVLSPSVPPQFNLLDRPMVSHGRTLSASAALQPKESKEPRNSTQSLREGENNVGGCGGVGSGLGTAESLSIHLMPPSPSFIQQARSGPGNAAVPGSPSSPSQQQYHHHHHGTLGHQSSQSSKHSRRSGSFKSLTAPFLGGKNYTIPGFSTHHPQQQQPSPTSTKITLPTPFSETASVSSSTDRFMGQGHHHPYQPIHQQQDSEHHHPSPSHCGSSSWFSRRQHSRDPSRSTLGSSNQVYAEKPTVQSSRLSMLETGTKSRQHSATPSVGSVVVGGRFSSETRMGDDEQQQQHQQQGGLRGRVMTWQESSHGLPMYVTAAGATAAFDQLWSLRAIPSWVPISSLKIAWGSLSVLVLAIGATIVYDFVQLAAGIDVVSG
ncbi:hypothetical protein BGZ94_007641 [Podila epigama]|nr:hypothetical protein BGZ94_007641 [Podila epigama]